MVQKDGLWGFISLEGKEVVKPKYEKINFGDSLSNKFGKQPVAVDGN